MNAKCKRNREHFIRMHLTFDKRINPACTKVKNRMCKKDLHIIIQKYIYEQELGNNVSGSNLWPRHNKGGGKVLMLKACMLK